MEREDVWKSLLVVKEEEVVDVTWYGEFLG